MYARRHGRISRVSVLKATVLAALLAWPGHALCAEAVVLASTAPDYELGAVIGPDSVITLPDGASATFLLATGQTFRVTGPFVGKLRLPETQTAGLLLVDPRARDQATVGGTRTVTPDPAAQLGAPVALSVDPTRSATHCVRPKDSVLLTRPGDAEVIVLRDMTGGTAVIVGWPEGQTVRPWPAEMPLADGAVYRASTANGTAELRFRRFDEVGNDSRLWAGALALSGCSDQAQAALAQLRDAVVPLDLYLTSDRGRQPVYRLGEPIALTVKTNRDAYLYCSVTEPDGRVIPIFPSQASGGAQVDGDQPLSLPGDRLPVELRARAPAGDNEVRCTAADRDLSMAIPTEFVSSDFRRLPENAAVAFNRAIERLPGTQLAEARIVIRVQ